MYRGKRDQKYLKKFFLFFLTPHVNLFTSSFSEFQQNYFYVVENIDNDLNNVFNINLITKALIIAIIFIAFQH